MLILFRVNALTLEPAAIMYLCNLECNSVYLVYLVLF